MNIAVNTRLLLKNKLEGIGWFSYETLKRITRSYPEHKFFFIFDRDYDESFIFSDNIIPVVIKPATRHLVFWLYWFEIAIPSVLKKVKADIFISPDGHLSLRSKVPSLAVIHDLNFIYYPEHLPLWARWYYKYFFKKYAQKSIRIGTVSEYSKNDINKNYNIDLSGIDVIYNGSNEAYSPVSEEIKRSVREQYAKSCEFFIFIGALNPRKNIPGLLKSFELFKEKTKLEHKLIIVGEKMHLTKELYKTHAGMKHKNEVIFAGRLEVEELHQLLASAIALVFIPYFEGFGIPVVEAMYCDVPVICSDRTSVPEVAGNAALMADPDDHAMIADYMQKIANNKELRNDLISKGRIQREKFSWDKSAKRFRNCLEKALKQIEN